MMDLRKTLMMIGGVFPVVCAKLGFLNEQKNLHRKKSSLEQEISGSIGGLSQKKAFYHLRSWSYKH